MSKLSREMTTLAKLAGGSYKTVHDRIRIMDRLCRHLLALNIQVRDVKYLKARHIESYVAGRLSQRIALRTLHNEYERGIHTLNFELACRLASVCYTSQSATSYTMEDDLSEMTLGYYGPQEKSPT